MPRSLAVDAALGGDDVPREPGCVRITVTQTLSWIAVQQLMELIHGGGDRAGAGARIAASRWGTGASPPIKVSRAMP